MKKIIFFLLFVFLFTSDSAQSKPRTIKGKIYYSSNNCLILKTVTGKKYNLKNYGSLAADQRVKLEVEMLPKGEAACDGPGTPVTVIKVVETYPKLTGQDKAAVVSSKAKTVKGKLYYSTNNCLILKTATGKKYNLKNYGSLDANQRVKLQVEPLPNGEIACDGPGTPVNVVKVVATYPKMTGTKQQASQAPSK